MIMARRGGVGALLAAVVLAGATMSPPAHAAPGNPPGRTRRGGGLTVGQAPPPLALDRIQGNESVTLGGLNGHVVILDFWATWCGPCRAVMPALDALYRRHRGQGLSVVGMSSENETAIRRHLARVPVDYTIARDVGGTMQRYGVRAIPTLVVLDRSGQVRDVLIGVDGSSMSRLEGLVSQLLAQPAP